MIITPLHGFEMIPYGVSDWTSIMNRNLQRLDEVIPTKIAVTAGETLAAKRLITLKPDGKWYLARADGILSPAFAFTLAAIAINVEGRAMRKGVIANYGTDIPGRIYYLSDTTPGYLTYTKPVNYVQVVGYYINSTDFMVNIDGLVI